MKDATGRTLSPTEIAEWQAMNDENARATDKSTTPSEYVVARADLDRKFGRVWQSS